ncbi:MAG: nucleotidyltransferase domain-containing protein [Planctomycetota bacterium]
MALRPVTHELILEMMQAIVQEARPDRIILFGSQAGERIRPDSDVDLIVIESTPFRLRGERREATSRIRQAIGRFRVPTDILVYSAEEAAKWQYSVNHVLGRALREGKVLYARC